MFGIPTPTMPSWLAKKHPDIMIKDHNGNSMPYGARRGYCTSNDVYRKKASLLTKALANHYKDEKQLVSWQLDNEIGHENSDMCWCESCHAKFIDYLKEKYSSIDNLNERWGTSFWTQTYYSFDDIPLPKPALTPHNPSLRLEWERFRSKTAEDFISLLYTSLKEVLPDSYVLHDFSGGLWNKHFNPFSVAKNMDEVAFNNYPVWGGQSTPLPPYEVAFDLDLMRGLKGQNFTVTEAIMGAQGHDIIGCAPLPGQAPLWSMQALAHGCQNLIYFRFRGFTKGAEQYCFGIIDSDNKKRRKFFEVQKLFLDAKNNEKVFESTIKNDVAIVFSYDSIASFKIQRQSDVFDHKQQALSLYKQFFAYGIGCDIVEESFDLSCYKIIVLPSMNVMDEEFKLKLTKYVENGGIVISTMRTAWKDKDNNLTLNQPLPCGLTPLLGGEIVEHESLLKGQTRNIISSDNVIDQISIFAEMIEPTTAQTLYSYHNSPFGEFSAITKNQYGKGYFFYLGGMPSDKTLKEIADMAINLANLTKVQNYSLTKETTQRTVNGETYSIQLDYDTISYKIEKI